MRNAERVENGFGNRCFHAAFRQPSGRRQAERPLRIFGLGIADLCMQLGEFRIFSETDKNIMLWYGFSSLFLSKAKNK